MWDANFAVKRGYLAQNPAKDRAGEADYVPPMNRRVEHAILSMSQLELLADKVSEVAEEQQVRQPVADQLWSMVEGKAGHDLMFCGGRGGALRNSNFTRRFYTEGTKRAQASDGTFPIPTFHDLRHTAVSLAIGSGASIAMDEQNVVAEGLARMMQATRAG